MLYYIYSNTITPGTKTGGPRGRKGDIMSIKAEQKEYRVYWCGKNPLQKGSPMEKALLRFIGVTNARICYSTNTGGLPKYEHTAGLRKGVNCAHAIATDISTPIDPSWKESIQDQFPLYYWDSDGWHNLTPNYFLK